MHFLLFGYGYWGKKLAPILQKKGELTIIDPQHSSGSLKEVLAAKKITHAVIATPEETHYDLAVQTLKQGIHTFVEKPLSLEHKHAQHLSQLAKDNAATLFVDYTFLYDPAVKQLKEFLQNGKIGALQTIFSTRFSVGINKPRIHVTDDLAPHDIYLFQYLTGEGIDSLTVESAVFQGGQAFEAEVGFKLAEVEAKGIYSWMRKNKERTLQLVGETGTLTWARSDVGETIVLSTVLANGQYDLQSFTVKTALSSIENALDQFITLSEKREQSVLSDQYLQDVCFLEEMRKKVQLKRELGSDSSLQPSESG